MRVRGTGRGLRTLSRFALIGVIGGGAAACSSDASRLGDPFGNPFASNLSSEPAATGSLPDGEIAPAPVVRTSRIQSQALGAPGAASSPAAMSPRPMAAAPAPARPQTTRLASTEPVSGGMTGSAVSGMNPDAARMSTRAVPAAPAPKVIDRAAEKRAADARREAEAREAAEAKVEAKRQAEAAKLAEARKVVEAAKASETRKASEKAAAAAKLAETKAAEARKAHPRPGQAVAKAEDKAVRKIEIKEAKAEVKAEAKADAAKDAAKKAEAARKTAEAEAAKLAKADAAKEAARKVAEAKAAEAAAKEAAKAPVKVAAVEAPKAEPASTGSVAASEQSFRWPAKGRVISGYGTSGNEGINISVPEGTAVKAAEDGTVAYAGSDVKGYGKLVLVRHSNGYVSAYAHNGELDVRPGEKVKRGQTIAKSGASGNVTSPQLHFEIRKGATPVDPMPHLASN
ncbi:MULTISPECIES: M23 family metallopeptidase [unclassified Methylobacterium]|uniref:M23 family metallopeptidase n=1 Tax=unclassified Methylobacterium TaxID=2615210 RepID=UPI0006FBDCAF|nr:MULTISPECIES: M23 family metallopeptidase [unclassified Methylobacterium]KQO62593.1 peptidase M23 [Methylobacterium sp. Leaf88]KQO72381.1 peptidase M23 [Methylobacterium sp. Leaf89]KQP74685.1 peptidase M23 [Methylobacterium sp. Leaf111]KQU25188.1 peptidase M23 [Methylobacterium sp. Leaf94]